MDKIKCLEYGEGDTILFLHGWGQNKEMMKPIVEELKYNYKCIIIDMPGFGESNFNNEKNLNEYTQTIYGFLERKDLRPKYIIGHSFGGKVALNYYFNYQGVEKIIFIGSPLLKPKRTIKYYFKIYTYKLKKILKKNIVNLGSKDYLDCKSEMKHFFINIVNTHFNKQIKQIKIPVLLIWGKKDDKVPLSKAKKLKKRIKKSELIIENGGHFAYLENIQYTRLIIQKFLRRKDCD